MQGVTSEVLKLMELTGCPSVSIGILHEGEIILQHGQGFADVDKQVKVDDDTCYMIGSLTKAFISASCGMLVEEGKLSWTAPLSTYIAFAQNKDPVIGDRATLSDALSHSSGFPQIDISWYGADGEDILAPEDLLHVTANMPVFDTFRAEFHYSNWPYALAGRIIEAVGGDEASDGWGGFVKKRIFSPLGMTRSTCSRSELVDCNLAEPHTVLSNRQSARLPIPHVSDKTICGAAMAIWSTIPDMLTWSRAILQRLEDENSEQASRVVLEEQDSRGVSKPGRSASQRNKDIDSRYHLENPLRRVSEITSHKFPITHDTIHENTYGFGWARHQIPSSQLGWLSINGPQKTHIIGKDSQPRLALNHGGQVTGYLNTIYLFPETKSAVVVLTNAQSAGDCSDLVAQMYVQALFDMEPKIDFTERATHVSADNLNQFSDMVAAYEKHRTPGTACPDVAGLEGSYWNTDMRVLIEVYRNNEDKSKLEMRLNKRVSQRHDLSHYHYDTFGFLPKSRDEKELRCLVDYFGYEQFLLSFIRSENGAFVGLNWVMQDGFKPLHYIRVK